MSSLDVNSSLHFGDDRNRTVPYDLTEEATSSGKSVRTEYEEPSVSREVDDPEMRGGRKRWPNDNNTKIKAHLLNCREDFGGVTSVRFSLAGDTVAVGFNSGHLQVCDSCTPRATVRTVLKGWEGNHSISCVRFHPQRPELLYAASNSGVVYRSVLSNERLKDEDLVLSEDNNEIFSFDFNKDATRLVTGGRDAVIRVYDTRTDKLVTVYSRLHSQPSMSDERMHEKRVYCVKSHPEDPSVIISGGWDRIVKVWDTRVKEGCVRNIVGPYIFGETIDINRGKLVTASCVVYNSLQLWDLGSGDLLKDIIPTNRRVYLHGEFPYASQFFRGDPSGDTVLCGGVGLGGLHIISISNTNIIHVIEDTKPIIACDSTDKLIAFGGKSNNIVSCEVGTQGAGREKFLVPN